MAEGDGGSQPREGLARLAQLPGAEAVLSLLVGGAEYGIPVKSVGEVLRVPRLTRVPLSPPEIRGIASVRGEVVAVVDLGQRLHGRAVPIQEAAARLVTVARPARDEWLALLVDGVVGLVDLRGLAVEEPPAEADAALPAGLVKGFVAPAEGRLLALLDLAGVLELDPPGGREPA